MTLSALTYRHRRLIYLLVVAVTGAGLLALFSLPASIYPEANFSRIAIIAQSATRGPRDMTVAVTRPIEEAMGGVLELRRIRSRTVQGGVEISLDFSPSADIQVALQQVQGRLAALRADLPADVSLFADRLTPSAFPIIQYQLTGAPPIVLRDLAQYLIRPRLAGLPDVGSVEVQGGRVRQITIALDPARLSSTGIGVDEVADAVRSANVVTAAGRIERHYRQYSVVVSGLTPDPAAVGEVVVRQAGGRNVRVADLGHVAYGMDDLFQIFTGDGRPAALINVSRQLNGNVLTVERGVAAVMDSIRPQLPRGAQLELVYNQAALVRESVGSVRDAMLLGGFFAVLVLLVFLGNWRVTLAAALTLPLSVIGTFAGLHLAGQSLNLMSLGGLAVAIGLIIDDAVVVVENIERRLALHPDEPPGEVVRRGTDEIFGAVAGSTLTTVVVFAPLGLLEGVVGDFFRSFAIALAISVVLSLVLAMTLIPALVEHWLLSAGVLSSRRGLSLARLEAWYTRRVAGILRHRRLALLGVAGLVVLAVGLARVMGTDFLPAMDEGGFILDYWTPTGSSLAETDRELHQIESILQADPDIQAFSRRTGAELGFAATAPNRGDITVLLHPLGAREASVYEVMDRVRLRIETELPEVRVEFVQLLQDIIGDLAGNPEPVEIKLFSADQAAAERSGVAIGSVIDTIPGLVDVFNGVQGRDPEVRVTLEPGAARRLGLTNAEVSDQARASLFGAEAGSAREFDRLVPIVARLPDSVRFDPDIVSRLPVVGPDGWAPLASLGSVQDTSEAAELQRENLRPLVAVTGRVSGSSLGAVMQRVRAAVAKVPLPAGVDLELGGQWVSQRRAFRQLFLVFLLASVTVLGVLVAQFRSYRGALAIALAAPLGITGAFLALVVTGVPFNVSSFMGLILLIGLVVKNGIILLDAAMRQREAGLGEEEALVEAGRIRMRPILMTTLCTLAGLLPLAFGFGSGSELQRPLAIAVVGGLTLSTVVTLVMLPVGLEWLGALRERSDDM